ncbi:MAG: hypothetical protein KDK27_13690, partial [Leptospiraceae bacterium]|nr:hypothetical protein [Leptospiraceae bacterium]
MRFAYPQVNCFVCILLSFLLLPLRQAYGQEQKVIHLATFQSLMDAPAPDIERQLATGLRQRLERSGFKV